MRGDGRYGVTKTEDLMFACKSGNVLPSRNSCVELNFTESKLFVVHHAVLSFFND